MNSKSNLKIIKKSDFVTFCGMIHDFMLSSRFIKKQEMTKWVEVSIAPNVKLKKNLSVNLNLIALNVARNIEEAKESKKRLLGQYLLEGPVIILSVMIVALLKKIFCNLIVISVAQSVAKNGLLIRGALKSIGQDFVLVVRSALLINHIFAQNVKQKILSCGEIVIEDLKNWFFVKSNLRKLSLHLEEAYGN